LWTGIGFRISGGEAKSMIVQDTYLDSLAAITRES
jgi:hypothetical protein